MANRWIGTRHRILINFLVCCSKGIIFIRSVDASDLVKNAINLSNLFDEIVNWVGPANIVYLVTDKLCSCWKNFVWKI